MRRDKTDLRLAAWLLALPSFLAAAPAAADTPADVETVIEKHIAARGGRERWAAVNTIEASGTFTAFSKDAPFVLHRKRDDRYHLDSLQNGRKVEIGYDGELAWWNNHWFQEGAQPMEGADLVAARAEFDFVNPLFDYEDKGYTVELIGETELEGMPAIGVTLKRSDEIQETWFLDPRTYLEIGRLSQGSDFGRPMEQRTYYDDFREVEGVMIPHYVETQWYTRDRVLRFDTVSLNVEIDDTVFEMPSPPGMGPFRALSGTWNVAVQQRPQPGAEWRERQRTSTFEPLMRGALVREHWQNDEDGEVLRTLSFDTFRDRYRVTQFGDKSPFMNILEGSMEDGRLTVSNLDTDTSNKMFGMTIHSRLSLFDIESDSFKMETEVSIDGGESWFVAAKADYSRAPEAETP